MKHFRFLLLLAVLALAACGPAPAPAATATAALATISALLPTTLAAYQLPEAATALPPPSATPVPRAPYPAPAATGVAQLPLAGSLGVHVAQPGDTLVCIGRAYGVLPGAIAQANGLSPSFSLAAGQVLHIPAVPWTDISDGPVCAAQFQSPFPGLIVPTAQPAASATPAGPVLSIRLNFGCVSNCGSKDGVYQIRVLAAASGGLEPYGFAPAETFDVAVPHCTNGQGVVTITSADGQSAQQAWSYRDIACPKK